MRDIRGDLEERANIIQEQLRASYAHFENVVQQLQRERMRANSRSDRNTDNDRQAYAV